MNIQNPVLPSGRSYLTLTSLPALPSSILSPPVPTSLSMPSLQFHNGLEYQPHHHRPFSPVDRTSPSSPPRALPLAPQHLEEDGDSLLLHTASALVYSALEQKGHSWLAARKSSTSLSLSLSTSPTTTGGQYFPPHAVHSHPCSRQSSAMSTPRAVRSRHHSRRSSTSKPAATVYPAADFVQREQLLFHGPGFDLNDVRIEKDASIKAESEVQNLLMARMGGWLEWAVGWMDFHDDDSDDDDNDYEVNENSHVGNNNRLSTIASGVHHDEDHHIQREFDFREGMEAPRAILGVMNNREDTAMNIKTKSEFYSEDRDRNETRLGDVGIPLPPATYPQVSSLVETGAGAVAGPEARAGNWAGVHDVWWGDAKWLFGVAGRVVW